MKLFTGMSLLTLGINHQTAPVEIREKVTFAPEQMEDALKQAIALNKVNEAVIVSTCTIRSSSLLRSSMKLTPSVLTTSSGASE